MPNATSDFAVYCCEILSSAGPCTARRMFGGWGISTDGLTIAIIANLGGGEKLWLKSDDASRHTSGKPQAASASPIHPARAGKPFPAA
jgi:DNA transformation protein